MSPENLVKLIADQLPPDLAKDTDFIMRQLEASLPDFDDICIWRFAITPYTGTIAANKNELDVGLFMVFKPISCFAVISDTDYQELKYCEMIDIERMNAASAGVTTSRPTDYSIYGRKLIVGPGLLTSAIAFKGKYQRQLTLPDLEYLPPNVVADRVVMRMLPKGTPGNIAAWSGWKEGVKKIQERYRPEAIIESSTPMDERIEADMDYLNNLEY